MNKILGEYDKTLFWSNLILCVFILAAGIIYPKQFESVWNKLQELVTVNFGWFYLLLVGICIVFLFWVTFSKYGHVKLGKDDDRPEYSTFSWIAMLFSCGVGVGFIFWGVAEPLYHYMQTPYLAEPGTPEAVPVALALSTMHWGLHGWALFSVCGLAIAFAAYRMNQPLTLAGGLYGILGDGVKGPWGRVADFLSAFATIAGISTTIGMGVISISYAATHLFGFADTMALKVVIMGLMILIFIISSAVGIKRGMKRISSINVWLALGVMIFLFVFGPTRFILNILVNVTGTYINNLVFMTFWTDPVEQTGWLGWWTVFYWGWWLAWTPFTAGFIAKISKGRTIREFLLGVLFLPTALTLIWFCVLGGSSIHAEINGTVALWEAVQANTGSGIYMLLTTYPLPFLMSIILAINLLTFIVTSADASSFYCAVVMSKGNQEPKTTLKIVMGCLIGGLGLILLLTGGLKALQTMSIVAALPFSFVVLLTMFSIVKMFKADAGQAVIPHTAAAKLDEVNAQEVPVN